MKKLLLALLFAATFASCSYAQDKSGWPSQLRFMSGPPGGNWITLGDALCKVWNGSGLPQSSSSQGAGVSNILNAHARRGDLGFSVTSLLGAALKGEADFRGRAVSNAVIMSNLYTQYTYFIMRKDFAQVNGIKSVEDIVARKPKMRFATLRPGTSSEFVVKALFDKAYGLDYRKAFQDWGGMVEYASYEGGADLLAENHLDCFAFSVGKIAPVVSSIESMIDVVILPVSQEALDKLSEAYGTVTLTVEPGIYKSLPEGAEPVKVVGDYTCIVIRRDLPESLVYELNRAMWDHKAELAAAVSDMGELDPDTALPGKVPAHEGSVKFWSSIDK
ncbi:MAG: TAXI family TRAP transporter solute-binding subunit [Synergistaceae bacterium]|nr:TAXI family TRAP transporter solute-binding subunit [Synergistaceae bacterium]